MKDRIGLHLRLRDQSLTELIQKAVRLRVPFFQFFLIRQTTRSFIDLDNKDVASFLKIKREHFETLFLHGSYWINLASITMSSHNMLERELRLAKRLELTHIVLHPGSAKGAGDRLNGIDAMARALNKTLKKEHDVRIVLENIAHGKMCVGGDLYDFKQLLEKLDHPEKVSFCIDTAHAHSYGYDITSEKEQDLFVQLLDDTIGASKIALIHLNDTETPRGKKIDRHHKVGEGSIGEGALKRFILHPKLRNIPVVMEPPVLSEEEELYMIKKVVGWHQLSR